MNIIKLIQNGDIDNVLIGKLSNGKLKIRCEKRTSNGTIYEGIETDFDLLADHNETSMQFLMSIILGKINKRIEELKHGME